MGHFLSTWKVQSTTSLKTEEAIGFASSENPEIPWFFGFLNGQFFLNSMGVVLKRKGSIEGMYTTDLELGF